MRLSVNSPLTFYGASVSAAGCQSEYQPEHEVIQVSWPQWMGSETMHYKRGYCHSLVTEYKAPPTMTPTNATGGAV